MNISIVVAASTNNVIGKNNQLLWHLPNDMKFFKQTTWGLPVIMGRKTFESLGNKPLNGRLNIILTNQENFVAEKCVVLKSIDDALFVCSQHLYNEVCIIGGGEVYKQAMPLASTIYITRVHTTIEGDTFFPEIKAKTFALEKKFDNPADDKHAFAYTFEKWVKL